jgi:hypothetical protein
MVFNNEKYSFMVVGNSMSIGDLAVPVKSIL